MNFYNTNIDYNSINNNSNSNKHTYLNNSHGNNNNAKNNINESGNNKGFFHPLQNSEENQSRNNTSISQDQLKSNFTNKLQSLLYKQDQNFIPLNNTSISNLNTSNITTNFYSITQYILSKYFKVNDINDLNSLKLIDLIVDQTFPYSLTLRKLNDNNSNTPYKYFNTVSRVNDITKCPIFALSIYFIIRWSNPSIMNTVNGSNAMASLITVDNYNSIPLLESNLISLLDFSNNNLNVPLLSSESTNKVSMNLKLARAEAFSPSDQLIYLVFPWLPQLKSEVLFVDRTNYKLNSICELFEFIGRTVVQDLKYLISNPSVLPNIVNFISKLLPNLFMNEHFKASNIINWNDNIFSENNNNNELANGNNIIFDSGNTNINDVTSISGTGNNIIPKQLEEQFSILSKRLTTENVRLNQQISLLKSELNSVTNMCNQILQNQKQLLTTPNNNQYSNPANNNSNNSDGIIILNKNMLNSNTLGNLVQYIEGMQRPQSQPQQQPQSQPQQQQQQQSQILPENNPQFNQQSMQPYNNPPNSNYQPQSYSRGNNNLYRNDNSGTNSSNIQKRKLPFPYHTNQIANNTTYPQSPSTNIAELNVENSYNPPPNKRLRLEDKQTPSQAALDSLLTGTLPTTKIPLNLTKAIEKGNIINSYIGGETPIAANGFEQNVDGANSEDNSPSDSIEIVARSRLRRTMQNFGTNGEQSSMASRAHNLRSTNVSPVASPNIPKDKSLSPEKSIETGIDETNIDINDKDNIDDMDSDEIHRVNSSQYQSDNIHFDRKGQATTTSGRPVKHNPNESIKYKLSRENKTIWDLYTEWYIGLNGKPSITQLIKNYGYRRWKVHDDSHFFPTRRIIMDYIETECDRGVKFGRFTNPNQPREDIRKILVGDLEKFRINNGLTLNSLSLYFRKLSKDNIEICIFENFKTWNVKQMTEDEKNKYCKRQHFSTNQGEN
ncbi:hypothetical protein Kpol_1048p60 [Vanderwaltozyma polyspora DSM 70294]|uniref:Transcription activator GCR1-like domain-containing protein n=1 Tax=Vanderwaltozyma polyspora (strain ATCC 22028 / DSM 70294 / BCRC 21397 / CBS 2163 / NBRC 10782 / NRRL Y-8283 / UCD 57-17) TaxID=436907 RepID=A7TGM2_VANPO|nr:uncharacterized protein Kpol_1048p60 [Vanderwaltozyma polyspora DSM 70294]EDO18629.1 hypothetical protein Kpol_1048p60 [Vanderwaltozyma polyspora DSM 70294]